MTVKTRKTRTSSPLTLEMNKLKARIAMLTGLRDNKMATAVNIVVELEDFVNAKIKEELDF